MKLVTVGERRPRCRRRQTASRKLEMDLVWNFVVQKVAVRPNRDISGKAGQNSPKVCCWPNEIYTTETQSLFRAIWDGTRQYKVRLWFRRDLRGDSRGFAQEIRTAFGAKLFRPGLIY